MDTTHTLMKVPYKKFLKIIHKKFLLVKNIVYIYNINLLII